VHELVVEGPGELRRHLYVAANQDLAAIEAGHREAHEPGVAGVEDLRVVDDRREAPHRAQPEQLVHAIEEPVYPYFYAPAGGFSMAHQLEELREKTDSALDKVMEETTGPEVPYEKFVVTGRPAIEITRCAEEQNSDMIVIATHGLSGLERLLVGSTAEQVVRLAGCPVFSVKSFGKSLI